MSNVSQKRQPYHDFVFDTEKRELVGDFENMYQQEEQQGFDSWYQEDTRHLVRKFALALLEQYSFQTVLDIGCGKGAFSHCLKKRNNSVTGIDLSQTAVSRAKQRFPDIDFVVSDLESYLDGLKQPVSLCVCMEVLSYIEDWPQVLSQIAEVTEYLLITLYIPENPIGAVKAIEDLKATVQRDFEIIEMATLNETNHLIFAAKS